MKKQLIVVLIILTGALIYYFATPQQTRLGDDYQPDDLQIQEETVLDNNERDEKEVVEDIAIYTYAKDDTQCSTPVPVEPEEIDKRYKYQEINILTTLFSAEVPEGYKSPFIAGTVLNQLRISQGTAYVDASTFVTLGDGPCQADARITAIEKSLTQFEDIDEVEILIDGEPLDQDETQSQNEEEQEQSE